MSNTRLNRIAIASFSMFIAFQAVGAAPALQSGKYESLMLAVTPEHEVDGYFSEAVGDGFSCKFYLRGKLDGAGSASITTWMTEPRQGTISATNDGISLTIPGGRDHPGCANVMMPEIDTGIDYSETHSKSWVALVTITADKAFLMVTPDVKSRYRGYVVDGDVVGVLGFEDGWAHVEFISDQDRSSQGWISAEQYQALTAPR